MNVKLYEQYLKEYIKEALQYSDKSNGGILQYLSEIKLPGRFARNRDEKMRALRDARQAFESHRHWPREIVLSHLGIKPTDLE